jgi:hypothetical protein
MLKASEKSRLNPGLEVFTNKCSGVFSAISASCDFHDTGDEQFRDTGGERSNKSDERKSHAFRAGSAIREGKEPPGMGLSL